MTRRGYTQAATALAVALALPWLAGCGSAAGGTSPALTPASPTVAPSLSPPLTGNEAPLVGIGDHPAGGRLGPTSPYPLFSSTGKLQADPINLVFIAARADLTQALLKAGWLQADPLNTVTKAKMVRSTLFHTPYPTAPVSDLFLFGRAQDFAFEKNSTDTRYRDHFRVWQTRDTGSLNRPIWVAAATKDVDVGINPNTGGPTHRIGSNIDAERELVSNDLQATGRVDDHYRIGGVGKPFSGQNGGDDYIFSDGMIAVISIKP